MKRRITEKSEERGWGWVYWVRLGKVNSGRVAGQAGERVERGLRWSEGGQKGKLFLKKQKHRAILVGEGGVGRKGLG